MELPGKIGDKLIYLFVPQEGIAAGTMQQIKAIYMINQAVQLRQRIHDLWVDMGFYGTPEEAPSITFTISTEGTEFMAQFSEQVTISLDWYTPYKHVVDGILSAFMLAAYLYRLFVNLPSIINGTAGPAASMAEDVMKGKV